MEGLYHENDEAAFDAALFDAALFGELDEELDENIFHVDILVEREIRQMNEEIEMRAAREQEERIVIVDGMFQGRRPMVFLNLARAIQIVHVLVLVVQEPTFPWWTFPRADSVRRFASFPLLQHDSYIHKPENRCHTFDYT